MTGNSGSGWIIGTGFAAAAKLIGNSPEEFAEIAYNVGVKWQSHLPSEEEENGRTWGATGEHVKVRDYPSRLDVRRKIWQYLEEETGVVLLPDGTVKL